MICPPPRHFRTQSARTRDARRTRRRLARRLPWVEQLEDRIVLDTTVTVGTLVPETAEGSTPASFRVVPSGNFDGALTIDYSVSGTATPTADYAPLSGTVTIPSGAPYADIIVQSYTDNEVEDPESVIVTLEGGSGYSIGSSGSALVGITDTTPVNNPTLTAEYRSTDPYAGCECGDTSALQEGNLKIVHPIDLDQQPDCGCGGEPAAALIYNSTAAEPRPIVQGILQTSAGGQLPPVYRVTLTASGETQTKDFPAAGSPGDRLVFAMQAPEGTGTGSHAFSFSILLDYPGTTHDRTLTATGTILVASQEDSPLGPGWSFSMVDRLHTVGGGVLRAFGTGGFRHYEPTTGGVLRSPGDPGVMAMTYGEGGVWTGWTYTLPDGRRWTFNTDGYQIAWNNADNSEFVTYTYDGGRLTSLTRQDGTGASFTYTNDLLSSIATFGGPASRTWTIAHSGTDLTAITDPAGGVRQFNYDADHHVISENFAPLVNSWTYDEYGLLRQHTWGSATGSKFNITPAVFHGLLGIHIGQITAATFNDWNPLNDYTGHTLDLRGFPLTQLTADTALWRWDRDPVTHYVMSFTDPLNRSTGFTYDANGYAMTMSHPDSTQWVAAYNGSFAGLTSFTNENGTPFSYAYDAQGHLTGYWEGSQPYPYLPHWSYTWQNGLMTSVTDPLGNISTLEYDTNRRLTEFTDALNGTIVYAYDNHGNLASVTDQLNHTTSYVHDALGRLTQLTDPLMNTWQWTYSPAGFLLSETDPRGTVTQYTYDSRGLLTQLQQAVGQPEVRTTLWTYDLEGRNTSVTDANNHTTTFEYDIVDRVTQITNPMGGEQHFTYDLAGQLLTAEDELGRVTNFGYNVRGWVTAMDGPLNFSRDYTYDAVGNLTSVIDSLGRTTRYHYDTFNQVTAVAEALGSSIERWNTWTYNLMHLPVSSADGLGTQTSYVYDALHRVTGVTEAVGTLEERSTGMSYDAAGNLISLTDPRGFVTAFAYDALNRNTSVTEAVGTPLARTSTTAYDPLGNVAAVTNPLGVTSEFVYDRLSQLTQITEAAGTPLARTWLMTYDPVGNLINQTDPLGRSDDFTYDPLDRLTQFREAVGTPVVQTWLYTYDAVDNLTGLTSPLGVSTQYVYDALNRPVSITEAAGTPLARTLQYEYDLEGNVVAATDPMGRVTQFIYDQLNRVTHTTEAYGTALARTTVTDYDANDNVTLLIDPLDHRTLTVFDVLNRPTEIIEAYGTSLARTTWVTYDAGDNLLMVTDPLYHTTEFTIDALGRRTQSEDALGGQTVFVYDLLNRLTSLTDPVGNTTEWTYDVLNRVTSETDPLDAVRTFQYDLNDNLTATTDRNGRTRQFTYDALDRRTSEVWLGSGGRTINYTWDAGDRLTSAGDPDSAYAYTYDVLDRLLTVSNAGTPGVPTVVLAYAYNANDSLLSLTATVGGNADFTNTYQYDQLDRLTRIEQSGSGVAAKRVDLAYNAVDQFTSLTRYADLAGSQKVATTLFTYDDLSRLTTLTHKNALDQVFAEYGYTFDEGDRITGMTSPDGASSFTHDDTNQLTGADHSSQADEAYTYDANGNRTLAGYVTGSGNRLLSDGVYNYTYDGEGNLTLRTRISDGQRTEFAWDHRSRLTQVQVKDAGGTVLLEERYTYDVWDLRIGVWTDADGAGAGVATQLWTVYDGVNPIADFNGLGDPGSLTTRYLNGGAIDTLLARDNAADVAWYVPDLLGSVRQIVNNAGTVIYQASYNSFGQLVSETGAGGGRFAFAGMERTAIADLAYAWHRYYLANTGQWISEDPISFSAGDGNLRRYVGNGPTGATDATGLFWGSLEWYDYIPPVGFIHGMYDHARGVYRIMKQEEQLRAMGRRSQQPFPSKNPAMDLPKAYDQGLAQGLKNLDDASKEAILDTVDTVLHPIKTLEDLEALAEQIYEDPGGTIDAIIDSIITAFKEDPSKACAKLGIGSAMAAVGGAGSLRAVQLLKEAALLKKTAAKLKKAAEALRKAKGATEEVKKLEEVAKVVERSAEEAAEKVRRLEERAKQLNKAVHELPEDQVDDALRGSSHQRMAVEEALEDGKLSTRTPQGAGVVRPPRHHIFPQEHRAWFKERGIEIDRWTVELDQGTHDALHYGKCPERPGGWWNDTIMKELRRREQAAGRKLTAAEIEAVGRDMMKQGKIADLPIIPYD